MDNYKVLGEKLRLYREIVTKKRAEHDLYQDQLKRIQAKMQTMIAERDLLDRVRLLFQVASEYTRNQAKLQLETLVTNALQFIFGPLFRFEIELTEHGGQPVAEFYVVTEWEGELIRNKPQDSRGGGVVDILSLALRIAFMESMQPRLAGPLILDEPGKHVSDDYIEAMVEFLCSVSNTFDRQIILVTHNAHLIESADSSYMISMQAGRSSVSGTLAKKA